MKDCHHKNLTVDISIEDLCSYMTRDFFIGRCVVGSPPDPRGRAPVARRDGTVRQSVRGPPSSTRALPDPLPAGTVNPRGPTEGTPEGSWSEKPGCL